MASLGDMVVRIVGDVTGFNKSLTDSQKKLAAMGVNVAAAIAVVGKLVDVIGKAAKEYMDFGSQIDDASKKTGLSTDAIQEWKYIAEQTGTTLEAVTGAVGMMTRGLETNASTFSALGIQVQNADGSFRSTTDLFNDTILTLSRMTDETKRDQMAFQLLGRSAQSLIPILEGGEDGINAIKKEAKDLGIVLDKQTITQADALGDSMLALRTSLKSAGMMLLDNLAPALSKIVGWFTKLITKAVDAKRAFDAYEKAAKGQALDQEDMGLAIKEAEKRLASLREEFEASKEYLTPGLLEQTTDAFKTQEASLIQLVKSLRAKSVALAQAAAANAKGTQGAKEAADAAAAEAERQEELAERLQAAADAAAEAARIKKEAEEEEAARAQAGLDMIEEMRRAREKAGDAEASAISEANQAELKALEEREAKRKADHEAELERIEEEKQRRLEAGQYIYGQIGNLVDTLYGNEEERIKQSSLSEEAKAKKIAQLKRKQASWDKAQAVVDIAIQTSLAVVKALPNIVLSGIIAALGAAQAAAVLAQPLPPVPLATGGIVMPQEGGTLAQIAEAGQPEVVFPLDKLEQFMGSMGNTHLVVNLDSRPILDTIFPATRDGTVLIDARAVVA